MWRVFPAMLRRTFGADVPLAGKQVRLLEPVAGRAEARALFQAASGSFRELPIEKASTAEISIRAPTMNIGIS